MPDEPLNVVIGLDKSFGVRAAHVCAESIKKHASVPVSITLLDQDWLRRIGLYTRQFYKEDGQCYDARDGKPFSSEFSFTRFLVPALRPSGWVVFMDGDFMLRTDIKELFDLFDPQYSLMCVKHDYRPRERVKMRGQLQQNYMRKNWSSLMAFNCDKAHLTPFQVNTMPGHWLHRLAWLGESEIGELPEEWNCLDGHSTCEAKAAHFTRGTPDMPGWDDTKYAEEWKKYGY